MRSYTDALPASAGGPILERAARLLPGLFLARIEGKSPVEYLKDPARQEAVRRIARRFLLRPADDPGMLADAVAEEVGA